MVTMISHKIIDGKKHAQVVKDEVQVRVGALKDMGWAPRLISIDIGEIGAVRLFIKNQQKACAEVGIEYENRHYPLDVTQREVESSCSGSFPTSRASSRPAATSR